MSIGLSLSLNPIVKAAHASLAGAVGTTKNSAVGLGPVTKHATAALGAAGRQRVNGALEAIESVRASILHNLEGFVVVVSASVAGRHGFLKGGKIRYVQ